MENYKTELIIILSTFRPGYNLVTRACDPDWGALMTLNPPGQVFFEVRALVLRNLSRTTVNSTS